MCAKDSGAAVGAYSCLSIRPPPVLVLTFILVSVRELMLPLITINHNLSKAYYDPRWEAAEGRLGSECVSAGLCKVVAFLFRAEGPGPECRQSRHPDDLDPWL
jgi:hypothetical protein